MLKVNRLCAAIDRICGEVEAQSEYAMEPFDSVVVTPFDRLNVYSQTLQEMLAEVENNTSVALRDEDYLILRQRVHFTIRRCENIKRKRANVVSSISTWGRQNRTVANSPPPHNVRHSNSTSDTYNDTYKDEELLEAALAGDNMPNTMESEAKRETMAATRLSKERRKRARADASRINRALQEQTASSMVSSIRPSNMTGANARSVNVVAERSEAILAELVDMSATLKGEATSINRTISLQTDKLGELGDTAEDNQSKVASETKSLTKFYRSSSSFFATLFRSIAVLVAFILTVLYMSLFSKRF